MEELLLEVARTARREQAVANQPLTNGLELLVYPLDHGLLVGLGFTGELARDVSMDDVLRKRSADIQRYGAWQAAVFADGSCYVVRRVINANVDRDDPILTEDQLLAAQELLT
jgi:hypothetical protein